MEQLPIYATSVSSDDQGAWLQDIQGNIEPGVHRVVVEDEQGNQDEAMLFVIKDQPVILERVTKIVPMPFAYGLAALFLIILALATLNVWLGRKADKPLKGSKRVVKRYLPLALVVSVVALLVTLAIGIVMNRQTNFLDQAKEQILGVTMPKIDVSGAVQTPFEHQGIEGLDLTVGDTSIRTVQGGRYVFSQITQNEGIRLNHAKLRVAFRVLITKPGPLDIPFDSELYNLLFDIQQWESRGKIGDIYSKLTTEASQAKSQKEYVQAYIPLFGSANIEDQDIALGQVREIKDWRSDDGVYGYPQVIQIEVQNSAQAKTYGFIQEKGVWKLVK